MSFYERDEKEPVVWESRRGDYVITLWRTVDVVNFDVNAEVTSWDKLRVRYQGKTVCKVQGGNWVDTARCCPELAVKSPVDGSATPFSWGAGSLLRHAPLRAWHLHLPLITWFRALATSHKGKSRVNAPVVTDPATCTVVGLFQ